MKKIVFVFLVGIALSFSAKAQPGTTVSVINNWQCDILMNVVAVCPDDCSQHSSATMNFIPYAPGWPGYIYPQAWLPGPPTCQNWVWDFAQIDFACADGTVVNFTQIGNPSSPCNVNNDYHAFTIPQDCADACFGGKTLVQMSWTKTGTGDIQIRIW